MTKVYGLQIPDTKGLINVDLELYVTKLKIKNFRGVFMRDTLPNKPRLRECGIMNLNTSKEAGSYWVCYYKDWKERIFFILLVK